MESLDDINLMIDNINKICPSILDSDSNICKTRSLNILDILNKMKDNLYNLQINYDKIAVINMYLNNINSSVNIMKDEDILRKHTINDSNNNFLVETYQLNELNENEKNIDVLNDKYLKHIKYLIVILLSLSFIYFILISIDPT
jgi:hypothetical protein